jgi:hypothetical protein
VVVHVGLTGMLVLEILVRHMGMMEGGVVVLMFMNRAEMLEPTRHLVVIVGDVEVMMRVGKSFVIVLLPSVGRAGVFHVCTSRRRVQRHLCSTRPKLAQSRDWTRRARLAARGTGRRRGRTNPGSTAPTAVVGEPLQERDLPSANLSVRQLLLQVDLQLVDHADELRTGDRGHVVDVPDDGLIFGLKVLVQS